MEKVERRCEGCRSPLPNGVRTCPKCGRLNIDSIRDRIGAVPADQASKPTLPTSKEVQSSEPPLYQSSTTIDPPVMLVQGHVLDLLREGALRVSLRDKNMQTILVESGQCRVDSRGYYQIVLSKDTISKLESKSTDELHIVVEGASGRILTEFEWVPIPGVSRDSLDGKTTSVIHVKESIADILQSEGERSGGGFGGDAAAVVDPSPGSRVGRIERAFDDLVSRISDGYAETLTIVEAFFNDDTKIRAILSDAKPNLKSLRELAANNDQRVHVTTMSFGKLEKDIESFLSVMHQLKMGKFRLRPDWKLKLDKLLAKTQSLRDRFLEGEYETDEKEEEPDDREEEQSFDECVSRCMSRFGEITDPILLDMAESLCKQKCLVQLGHDLMKFRHERAMAIIRNMQG